MFGSKSKRAFREAKKLIRKQKWNEALAVLDSFSPDSDVTQKEIDYAIQEAKAGLLARQKTFARQLIKNKKYQDALDLLGPLASENPNHSELSRLIGQAQDGLEHSTSRGGGWANKWVRIVVGSFVALVILAIIVPSPDEETDGDRSQQGTQTANALIVQRTATQRAKNTEVALFETATAVTWTPTATYTSSPSPTKTLTPTSTLSPTKTLSPTPTATATNTLTLTTTPTVSVTPTSTKTNTPTITPVSGSVRGGNVNSRICPDVSCEVVRVASQVDEFAVLGKSGEWYWIEYSDGQTAYIFGELVALPPNANIAVAPTLTPSFTPITPTRTSTPRPSETPFKFDQDLTFSLIQLALLTEGYKINSIEMMDSVMYVEVPDIITSNEQEAREYRIGYIGALTGAITTAYQNENVVASPPRRITTNFMIGDLTMIRVTFNYDDGVRFLRNEITAVQFFMTWRVE